MSSGVLVLGATGQLGRAIVRELSARGVAFVRPTRSELDLAAPDMLEERLAAMAPRAVLNAAAFNDVAGAERPDGRASAFRINRDAPAELARTSSRLGIPLLHVSSDYVFDGSARRPYREDDPTGPLQVYGLSKLEGEKAVLSARPDALVVRTSTLFGPGSSARPNYVDAILAQAERAPEVTVVETPVSSPTYAVDLASALLRLLEVEATGLLHVTNAGECSRLELARAVIEAAGLAGRVRVFSRPPSPGSVRRPSYSVLDTTRFAALTGGHMRSWQEAVEEHVRQRDR